MFDYVKNNYNKKPKMVKKKDIKSNFLYVEFTEAPYMDLECSMDDFLRTHKSKFWYNLNRFERIYKKEHGELIFDIVKDKELLDEFLDKVYVLFNEKWKNDYTSSSWKHEEGFEQYKRAMIELASKEASFLAVLYDKDRKLLSYGYCLTNDDTVYFYQHTTVLESCYRKYSLGKILIHNLLKYLTEERRYKRFDFMNGSQSYKLEWAKKSEMVYIEVGKQCFKNYIKYFFIRLKVYLQFNIFFRKVIKAMLIKKEVIFGKF